MDGSGTTVDVSGSPDVAVNVLVDLTPLKTLKKFRYRDVDDALTDAYNTTETNNSTICDIMAIYLKGQKLLYSEAKTHCEQKLNFLMLPSIFLTVLSSILTLVMKDMSYGSTIVSSLNGATAFLLALINYMKLDARAEAHRTTAYNFDKLESSIVFTSGKVLFIQGAGDNMKTIIEETEKKVREIKETNPFVLPEHIRYDYPVLCGTNVFAEVKKIQTKEMLLTNNLKDLFNDIQALEAKPAKTAEDVALLTSLDHEQKEKTMEILAMRNEYTSFDKIFTDEMERNLAKCSKRCQLCPCLKV
jgi:site-specific DNA-adenine methylase